MLRPSHADALRLCTGVLVREGRVLLVASRYPNQAEPLWGLPGGRQRDGELLTATLAREWREETGLAVAAERLLYVSESYDLVGGTHVVNATFGVLADGAPQAQRGDAHVVDVAWVPLADVAARIAVAVVREPLLAWLGGDRRAYYGFSDAGVTIEFFDPP